MFYLPNSSLKIHLEKEEGIILNILQVLYLKKYGVMFLEVRSPFVYLEIKDSASGNGKNVISAIKMLPGIKEVEEIDDIEKKDDYNEEIRESYLKKGNTLHEIINKVEKEVITEALNNYESARKAAKALGVSHTIVLNKMKKFGPVISDPGKDSEEGDKNHCEICGVEIEKESTKCSDCEVLKVEDKEDNAQQEKKRGADKSDAIYSEEKSRDETKINCKNCGATLKYGAIFCPNCFSS